MGYFPNIQAVEWFKQNIFDKISLFDKKIKLYIIWKNAPKSIKNLASDRIIVEDWKTKILIISTKKSYFYSSNFWAEADWN